MKAFDIQAAPPHADDALASGGNQQRAVLARELSASCAPVAAQLHTRGLDVGAIEYMSARLRKPRRWCRHAVDLHRARGGAHVVPPHLRHPRGTIVGEMPTAETDDLERLGLLMEE